MLPERRRVAGVDAARGVALIGMMSVHIVPRTGDDGSTTLAYLLADGRASALFAVLAGVGLALARPGARAVLARAGVIAGVGLTLGLFGTPVAVILVHYAVLFCCAIPFMRLPARLLGVVAGLWVLLVPVLAHLLRTGLPPGPGGNPSWLSLAEPGQLLTELFLTGYYPVLPWTGYVLVGLTVGRLPLRRTATALWLVLVGVVLAVGARLVSTMLVGPGAAGDSPFYGTTPVDSWWWLAVAAPHSGTPPDLVHTVGTSLAVLGLCVLVGNAAPWAVLPLASPGSMTFTLYTAHVVALGLGYADLAWHVVAAVVVGVVWRSTGRRGPLEGLAAGAAAEASRAR